MLRTALSVLQRHVATGALLGTMTIKARSLVPLGAGPLAGLTARPYFTRRHDMQRQLQALAAYCEERWVTKIGQGPSFQVHTEAQERQEAIGRWQESRLNADDRRRAAHRLTEPVASMASNITSKGGASGKRGLFALEYVPEEGRQSGSPSRCSDLCGEGFRSRQRFCVARNMIGLHVCAAGKDDEVYATVAGLGITRRSIDTNRGRLGCVCSTRWVPVLDVRPFFFVGTKKPRGGPEGLTNNYVQPHFTVCVSS